MKWRGVKTHHKYARASWGDKSLNQAFARDGYSILKQIHKSIKTEYTNNQILD